MVDIHSAEFTIGYVMFFFQNHSVMEAPKNYIEMDIPAFFRQGIEKKKDFENLIFLFTKFTCPTHVWRS